MNDDTPLSAIGDEPVEARIVAWVLGEASAFEVAELERLCEERPELLVFRRRMRALHGLLIEAEAAKPDDSWKLAPENRQTLDELFGKEKPQPVFADLQKERRIRHSGRRALFAIAACLVLTVVVAGLLATGGKSGYKSTDVMAAKQAEMSKSARVSLTTELPPERIEGTPRSIRLPGISPLAESTRGDDNTLAGGTDNKPAEKDGRAENEETNPLRDLAKRDVSNSASRPQVTPALSPEAARVGTHLQQIERSQMATGRAQMAPQTTAKRVFAEGASSSYQIPDPDDRFGEMAKLSSLSGGGGISGGLGGAGTGAGTGTGTGEGLGRSSGALADAGAAAQPQRQPRPRVLPEVPGTPAPTPAPAAQAQAAKELAFNDGERGAGKANSVFTPPPTIAPATAKLASGTSEDWGLRSGDQALDRVQIEGKLSESHLMAGEKQSLAENKEKQAADQSPVPGDVPVLGALFARRDKSVTDEQREVNGRDGRDQGKTTVGGALSVSESAPLGPADSGSRENTATAKSDQSDRSDRSDTSDQSDMSDSKRIRASLLSQVEAGWEKASPADAFFSEYNLGSDYSEYNFNSDRVTHDESKRFNLRAQLDAPVKPPDTWLEMRVQEMPEYAQTPQGNHPSADSAALRKAIKDQEDKVEERRKVLATIVRTKGIIYKGTDSFYDRSDGDEEAKESTREEAIKRGLDAQDFVDARRDFEKDQKVLQQMKLKLLEESGAPHPEPEQPKPDLTKLMEETAAAEDPYSTFSLNISDASFQIARAAVAKGERPDPAGIKVEQFYNAVDYGDPSPTAGEPVAVAIEQAAHPVIPGRNLVRVALKTAAAGRSASQALRLTLLVDQSGSMVREDRRAAMDKALAGLAGLLTKNDLVTVVGFARTPRLLADGWTGGQAAKLTDLVNQSASEGGTNLEEAIKLAEQLAERRKLAGAQNRIVLFTDGAANLGDADPAHLAAKVKALRQKGIAFDIAGIAADDLNDGLLGELARNGNGRYYVVGKGADENFARQLAGAFRPAAENVKVQVHFNPERVGRYKLIGFEKDRLKTEDFRNDAVDAAELAAEEAGVAIYQVEPLPGGSGELGDVSVRFHDTASNQMVERTWTIPFAADAPAFDRAKPSMQLAVLAMLAAEKLRGGPLAEAIDFKQLAEARANVRRFYGHTGRVAEVLRMIDSL